MDKTILVVEDDFYISDLYRIALTKFGYVVETAGDGETALYKVKEQAYILILLDIMLPKKTGIEVLKELKEQSDYKSHKTPVIITSNLGQESVVENALQLGAAKYFIKSQTKIQDVISEVEQLLKSQAAGNE